jgi:hypothetical protein
MPPANPVELSYSPISNYAIIERVHGNPKVKGQVADSTWRCPSTPSRYCPSGQQISQSERNIVCLHKHGFGGKNTAVASKEFLFSQSSAVFPVLCRGRVKCQARNMTGRRRVFDFGIAFTVGSSPVERASLVWWLQLPSSNQAKVGKVLKRNIDRSFGEPPGALRWER